jgi:hypothetical protein
MIRPVPTTRILPDIAGDGRRALIVVLEPAFGGNVT